MYVPLLIECRVFFSRYIPHPMIVSQIFALLGLYKAAHFRQEWPYVVPIHITMYLIHMLQVGILSSLIIYIHTYIQFYICTSYITGFIIIYLFFAKLTVLSVCNNRKSSTSTSDTLTQPPPLLPRDRPHPRPQTVLISRVTRPGNKFYFPTKKKENLGGTKPIVPRLDFLWPWLITY